MFCYISYSGYWLFVVRYWLWGAFVRAGYQDQ